VNDSCSHPSKTDEGIPLESRLLNAITASIICFILRLRRYADDRAYGKEGMTTRDTKPQTRYGNGSPSSNRREPRSTQPRYVNRGRYVNSNVSARRDAGQSNVRNGDMRSGERQQDSSRYGTRTQIPHDEMPPRRGGGTTTRYDEPTTSRRQPNGTMRMNEDQAGAHAAEESGKGIFKGLSMPQVIGTALAAITSMLLSSKIGIAGGVIGVAVASIVSTVTAQVYKNFLAASADKMRNLADTNVSDDKSGAHDKTYGVTPARTQALTSDQHGTATPHLGNERYAQSELARKRAEKRQRSNVQRKVVIIAVVSALIAVALTAVVVNVVSNGEGIGTKTTPIVSTSSSQNSKQKNSDSDATSTGTNGSSSSSSTTDTNSSNDSTSSSQQDTSSGSSSNTSSGSSESSSSSGTSSGSSSSTNSGSGSGDSSTGSNSSGSQDSSSSGSSSSNTSSGSSSGTSTSSTSGT
jgi:uncharacterized protein (DUF697 family)